MRAAKIVILLLILPLMAAKHDFYVSITTAKWNSQSHTWQVSIKLFKDDVEHALSQRFGKRVRIAAPSEQVDSLLAQWVLTAFTLKQAGHSVAFNFLGREAEPELLWVYLESSPMDRPSKLVVGNELLMREFKDQTNLVHLEAGDRKASLFLRNSNPSQAVDL